MLKIRVVMSCLICLYCADSQDLPHCEVVQQLPVDLIKENQINVIYTMRSSCKFCTETATMLLDLKASLRTIGINAHFIVAVNNKSDRLSGLAPHITVNKRRVWKTLGRQNDHFYIFDRCGRMVYEIISPWSDRQLPFIRAAIKTTQFNHPCGLCPQDYNVVKEEKLEIYPPMVEENLPDPAHIPLSIVMRLRHVHRGDPTIYNHIVLRAHKTQGQHHHLPEESVTKPKPTPTSTSSLRVSLNYQETHKVPSMSDEVVSIKSENNKHLSSEHKSVSNSIKNLGDNSLRMANNSQLLQSSSESKNSSIIDSAPSEENIETSVTEINYQPDKSTETNVSIDETSSDSDYLEASLEKSMSEEEDSQLSYERDEKEFLTSHYKKILDWIS